MEPCTTVFEERSCIPQQVETISAIEMVWSKPSGVGETQSVTAESDVVWRHFLSSTAAEAGKTDKSARREFFYYDETDLMAIRVDAWKMHIGIKKDGSWFNEKTYPSVPYVFNLLMDPQEKMDPESPEWGYIGRKFVAQKLWAPTAGVPFLQAHLKSLQDYPPSQGAIRSA